MNVARVIIALAIVLLSFITVGGQSSPPGFICPTPQNPLLKSFQGGDVIPFSSGMFSECLPKIPNLEFGFQYFFGDKVRSGQVSGNYLLPVTIGRDAVLFGEAHGNYWNFGQRPPEGTSNRIDVSLGGGYRKILGGHLLLGLNGFYDASRLFNQWYSSGGLGMEMAAIVGTSDAFDLNANWYGDLFSSSSIINAFRNNGGSYDIEAGYSHAMFDDTLDLRLKFAGYQYNVGSPVYGYKTGADLTTGDGVFTVRYEYGNDKLNGPWNNVGAFVNIGFQMENILKGETPFTMPEPMFRSPRNINRMLTQTVKRDWNQHYAPGRAALATAAVSPVTPVISTIEISTLNAGTNNIVLTPVIYFSETQNCTTFTIAFGNTPPTPGNLRFQLVSDVLTSYTYRFDGKSMTFSNSGQETRLFSIPDKTFFNVLRIYNFGAAWGNVGNITLTWQ